MGRGMLAIDVDSYKHGDGSWDALREDAALDDDTVRAITGRGGLHVLYSYPPSLHVPSVPLTPRGYPAIECKSRRRLHHLRAEHPSRQRPAVRWEEGWGPGERGRCSPPPTPFSSSSGPAKVATARAVAWHPLSEEEMRRPPPPRRRGGAAALSSTSAATIPSGSVAVRSASSGPARSVSPSR